MPGGAVQGLEGKSRCGWLQFASQLLQHDGSSEYLVKNNEDLYEKLEPHLKGAFKHLGCGCCCFVRIGEKIRPAASFVPLCGDALVHIA